MENLGPVEHAGPIERIDAVLDHVAVAAERVADLWPRYVVELAGEWLGGDGTAGFAFAQVIYANGMKLEGLEPQRVEETDFLRRFLDGSGPGAHHLTFKVSDIAQAIDAATAAGFPVVGVNLDDPSWKEAFLYPKAACGIVVQLAESHGGWEPQVRPAELASPRTPQPARLERVTHAVADLDAGRRLFEHLLGGSIDGQGRAEGVEWVDLGWPGGGTVRLLSPIADGPVATWIGDRPGRFHHLAFTTIEPQQLAGAEPGRDGTAEVPPEANLGVRLLLSPG
jgi:hypothetical protein